MKITRPRASSMDTSIRRPGQTGSELDERRFEDGQALVEYSLIIVLIIIAVLAMLFTFQDSVINGLWGTTKVIVDALSGGA